MSLDQLYEIPKSSFEQVGKNHKAMFKTQIEITKIQDTMSKIIEASIKSLEMQIGKSSRQIAVQASLNGGFFVNTVDNPKNESRKAIELINKVVPSNLKVSDERK